MDQEKRTMAKSAGTQVKGVSEALAAVKGGKTTKKKAPTKKKAAAKKKTAKKAAPKAAKKTTKKAAKKVAKKVAKKTTSKAKASSGQGGPSLDLPIEKVSAKERRVLESLDGSGTGTRVIWTIVELAADCWKSKSKKQANSWVRNSLRRLVRAGIVEKVERGQFRISDAGRKKLARAAKAA
jgi:hypothetical protein